MLELTVKEAIKIIQESDISKGKYDPKLAAAEMKVLECVKNGWKISPPKNWHHCYISDDTIISNLMVLFADHNVKTTIDEANHMLYAYCSNKKWKSILRNVCIYSTPIVPLPVDMTELKP
jgi:hypothetical protein